MLVAGAVGMVINLAAAWVLHPEAEDSLNVEGASYTWLAICWVL